MDYVNIEAILDEYVSQMNWTGTDMVLLDFALWKEALRVTKLQPTKVGNDEEITYKGLRIRPSAAR